MLDLLPLGAVLLCADGRLYPLNATAAELIETADVRDAIDDLSLPPAENIGFKRLGKQRQLEIAALRQSADAFLLIVSDRSRTPNACCQLMRILYGLTATEARVVSVLLRGSSTQRAASELHISIHTLRRHLKRIFQKLNVRRQSDMVRVVTAGIGGLRFDRNTPNG